MPRNTIAENWRLAVELLGIVIMLFAFAKHGEAEEPDPLSSPDSSVDARYVEAEVISSFDNTRQPLRYACSPSARDEKRPVLLFLHSWSSTYHLHKSEWLNAALNRDWIFVEPNFRGANNHPLACGSAAARADILDAVGFAINRLNADPNRIYLAGASGGGHMAMLMAGRHPERFSAVSAWVGISDLAQWYQDHTLTGEPQNYAKMIASCCGGAPGASPTIDEEYFQRSPIHWITRLGDLPMDIAAGVHDGHSGSVPIHHSIRLYNKISEIRNVEGVSQAEMEELWNDKKLLDPQPQDTAADDSYGREIKLRRHAGNARLTIFEGGHEGLAEAACAWLENYQRPTRSSSIETEANAGEK